MTPELKIACEVVFQEHKVSAQPIKWNRDAFRGRISIGLSEMAKQTLVKKNIILLPHKSKKIITQLNPAVVTAASFEEAEEIIVNKTPALVSGKQVDHITYIADPVPDYINTCATYSHLLLQSDGNAELIITETKWYLKPLFYYIVWPLCAAVAGAIIAFLIDFTYTELFLNTKY